MPTVDLGRLRSEHAHIYKGDYDFKLDVHVEVNYSAIATSLTAILNGGVQIPIWQRWPPIISDDRDGIKQWPDLDRVHSELMVDTNHRKDCRNIQKR